MTESITHHLFGESIIRTVSIAGEPWFVVGDVCKILEISNSRMVSTRLHEDDVSTADVIDSMGRTQTANVCNESGLYQLVFKSRKAIAREFTRWITSEVLPSLRKRGFYGRRELAVTTFVKDLLNMGLNSRDATKLALSTFPPLTTRERQMLDLESANLESIATQLSPDHTAILSLLRSGGSYRITEILEALPQNSRILRLPSTPGRQSALGKLLRSLVKSGHIRHLPGRHSSYELCDNVVAMNC